nr:hypothetical protein [Serratia marcescens]
MTENDTLPLPGEFTDRGGSTGRFDDDAVCYLETVATVSTAR